MSIKNRQLEHKTHKIFLAPCKMLLNYMAMFVRLHRTGPLWPILCSLCQRSLKLEEAKKYFTKEEEIRHGAVNNCDRPFLSTKGAHKPLIILVNQASFNL